MRADSLVPAPHSASTSLTSGGTGILACPLSSQTRPLSSRFITILFFTLLLLSLIPVWSADYFVTQDGPAHVQGASLLLKAIRGEPGLWREYYYLNPRPVPNWVGHLVLAGLMLIFSPPVAEKILVTGYFVLLPLAMRYALRALTRRRRNHRSADFASLLVFPLAYHSLLHMGFYNFCYGTAIYLIATGYWLRHRRRFRTRSIITFAVLMALAYFSHLFCLVALWLTLAAFIIFYAIEDYRAVSRGEMNWRQFDHRFRRLVLRTLFAALPTLALMCALILCPSGDSLPTPGLKATAAFPAARFPPLSENPLQVLSELPSTFVSFSTDERFPAVQIVLLIAALFVFCLCRKLYRRQWDRCDILLLLIAFFIALACLASDVRAREFFVRPRALLFICLLAILWIGAQPFAARTRTAIAIFATLISLISFTIQFHEHQRQSDYLSEYLSIAAHLEPDRTLLPLFTNDGWFTEGNQRVSVQISPFVHAAGYLAAARNCIDLHNYEANTDHFPILFRPRKNPYAILGRGIELQPPRLDLSQSSSVHIDYILLWGDRSNADATPTTNPDSRTGASPNDLMQQLSAWHLIFRSPHHDARLYRNPQNLSTR